jgi:hypothetical protein
MRAKLAAEQPGAEGVAERLTASLAAKPPVTPAPPPPPKPAVGQVWRAIGPARTEPRFVAVVAVEKDAAEIIEITKDGARVDSNTSKGRPFRTSLYKGDMNPSGYIYEPGIAVDIETLLAREEKENPMSTQHSESVPNGKKVPGIPTAKKAKPVKAAKPAKAEKPAKVAKEKATPTTDKARLAAWAKHAAERAEQSETSVEKAEARLKSLKADGSAKDITAAEKKVEKAKAFAKLMKEKAKKWAAAASAAKS